MSTFGLVHGAYHGPWCWEQLTAQLERRGHQTLTVDLPSEDPDAGAADYAEATVEAFADAPDDLVLVGHSLGGLTIPLVAQRRPVSQMVFLCAMLPRPGHAHDDVARDEPDMICPLPQDGTYTGANGSTRWHPDAAAAVFFSDCPPERARWAANHLRGQHWKITQEMTPLSAWPDVPASAIIGSSDRVINPAWSRRVVPTVLGVTPIELDCGHSPFLATPDRLAAALVDTH
jgi:pimeloyl-ACP methyl ester carboxylesterase